jgi:uncharacterized protein YjiS (DUF1127 family)
MFKNLTFRSDGAFWPLVERPGLGRTGASGGLLGKATALVQRWRARHAARQAIEQLESFDDRTLRDIGISRDQIYYAVHHGRAAVRGAAFDIGRWS